MTLCSRRDILRGGLAAGGVAAAGCLGLERETSCRDGRTVHEVDAPPVPDASWPMRKRDAGRTAFDPTASVPIEVSTHWRYTGCAEVECGATVANGSIYPGQVRIDATSGSQVWGEWSGYQQPAVVDGTLYVGSHDLEAYDADDGSELWTFDPVGGAGAVSPPVVQGDLVYVAGNIDDRTVYAVDAATGDEEWRFTPIADCDAPITVAGDTVYAVDDTGIVYALDAASGEKRWDVGLDQKARGPPAASGGTVYVATVGGSVYALAAADGSERWHWRAEDGDGRSISVTDETVIVVGPDDARALTTDDATERWSTGAVGGSVCSAASETVVVGDGRNVTAVSRDDGAVQWTFETRSVMFGDYSRSGVPVAPALVDGLVVVTTEASDLYVLGSPV